MPAPVNPTPEPPNDYRDRVELTECSMGARDGGVRLAGVREGKAFDIRADFLIDASGPGGFLARQLSIPSAPLDVKVT